MKIFSSKEIVDKVLYKNKYLILKKTVIGKNEDIILDLETSKKIDFKRDTLGIISFKEIGGEVYFYVTDNHNGKIDLFNKEEQRVFTDGENVDFFDIGGINYVSWKTIQGGKSLYSFEKSNIETGGVQQYIKDKGIIFYNEDDIDIDEENGIVKKGKGVLGSGMFREEIKL